LIFHKDSGWLIFIQDGIVQIDGQELSCHDEDVLADEAFN
jgi:hypothetical protein